MAWNNDEVWQTLRDFVENAPSEDTVPSQPLARQQLLEMYEAQGREMTMNVQQTPTEDGFPKPEHKHGTFMNAYSMQEVLEAGVHPEEMPEALIYYENGELYEPEY